MIKDQQLFAYGGTLFLDHTLYCQVVGRLQYVTVSQPELAFAVNRVSQYMHNIFYTH